ncbi:MTH538 TIR-like domain (DUF1863) [Mactra antiquata]
MFVIRAVLLLSLVSRYECTPSSKCDEHCLYLDSNTLICTNIPSCVPDGVNRVKVEDTSIKYPMVTNLNFTGRNWNKVTYLQLLDFAVYGSRLWTISNASFVALDSLRELHVSIKHLKIDSNALVGLPAVKVIDFSCSTSLNFNDMRTLFNGTNKVANVNEFNLWEWDDGGKTYNFDDTFVDMLYPRNITKIDVRSSGINVLNITTVFKRWPNLRSFNVSYSLIKDIYIEDLQFNDVENVDILDISGIGLPEFGSRILPQINEFNNSVYNLKDQHRFLRAVLSFPRINASGIFGSPISLSVNNYTIDSEENVHFYVKELELKKNNLNRLDLRIKEPTKITSDLVYLGLSSNDIEYLHHSLLSCMPNLTRLDLSNNFLYKMVAEDILQFETMLSGVPVLENINLSKNNLTNIPSNYFRSSKMLVSIDLSFNRLHLITFDVSELQRLQLLDLSSNDIKFLDSASLQFLSIIPRSIENNSMILTSNPISCSQCRDKSFLQWILSTKTVNVKSQNLKCINEEGRHVEIDDVITSAVQYICIRNSVIISSTLSAMFLLTSSVSLTVWLYRRRIRRNQLSHRNAMIEKIQQGQGKFNYAAFLSYSSEDGKFVANKVIPDLERHLHAMTRVNNDRKLICTGDANLRPGFYVHDEIDTCIDLCSVVIILVTEEYCKSNYCTSELEKAYIKRRPVILMFKDYVNENLMTKTMKDLYKRNVRILWMKQNEEYILQTSWENVCTAILDLMA